MVKNNKYKLLVSSLITLLPIPIGLILWEYLPQQILHSADDRSSQLLAIFAPPIIALITHWVCAAAIIADPKNKDQSKKTMGLALWLCPFISLFTSAFIYSTVFGMDFTTIKLIIMIPEGLMFIVLGNYLPKCKQNSTLGIKVKWTLENEKNWNATHRFGGKLWFIGGLIILISVLLPNAAAFNVMIVIILMLSFIPTGYSYVYYRKQLKSGTTDEETIEKKTSVSKKTKYLWITLSITFIICLGTVLLLFIGDIKIQYGETSFNISTAFWEDLTVNYADIESVEYCDKNISGARTFGYGSFRLLMGTFQNNEYGQYTRYTYTNCDSSVVLNVKGEILVISGADTESTKVIYNELIEKLGGN